MMEDVRWNISPFGFAEFKEKEASLE